MLKERDLMQLQIQHYTWNNDDKATEDRVFFVGNWNYFFAVWHRWKNNGHKRELRFLIIYKFDVEQ